MGPTFCNADLHVTKSGNQLSLGTVTSDAAGNLSYTELRGGERFVAFGKDDPRETNVLFISFKAFGQFSHAGVSINVGGAYQVTSGPNGGVALEVPRDPVIDFSIGHAKYQLRYKLEKNPDMAKMVIRRIYEITGTQVEVLDPEDVAKAIIFDTDIPTDSAGGTGGAGHDDWFAIPAYNKYDLPQLFVRRGLTLDRINLQHDLLEHVLLPINPAEFFGKGPL